MYITFNFDFWYVENDHSTSPQPDTLRPWPPERPFCAFKPLRREGRAEEIPTRNFPTSYQDWPAGRRAVWYERTLQPISTIMSASDVAPVIKVLVLLFLSIASQCQSKSASTQQIESQFWIGRIIWFKQGVFLLFRPKNDQVPAP